MAEAAIAASAAVCVAVLGALLSFIYSRQLQRRQARLERLNAQLRDFYGPLYAIFQANRIAHLQPRPGRLDAPQPWTERRTPPMNESGPLTSATTSPMNGTASPINANGPLAHVTGPPTTLSRWPGATW
jgi:hypothetical protein